MLLRFTNLARCQSWTVAITRWNWWKAKRWKPAFGGRGRLKVAQVLEIGVQVTRALIAAANQGLIHRDLKPANIMLTRSEDSSAGFEVKVIDFGLAKVTAESFGEMDLTHGGFVGTPSYASQSSSPAEGWMRAATFTR
jgi:Serine/threonine protein kinase